MGIINETAGFLCDSLRDGASFTTTLTLGRQSFYVDRKTLDKLAARSAIDPTTARTAQQGYADVFFNLFLHSRKLDSLDNSAYEGATIVHDLNTPVPSELEENYDAVIDAGALEHVFNFPVAIANCMKLVRTGGRLFIFTPANNQLGHGFYQFSPELFFQVLAPSYGFEIRRMLALEFRYMGAEFGAVGAQYAVMEPSAVQSRVSLANSRPVGLLIEARKTRHVSDLFRDSPQQSDYLALWGRDSRPSTQPSNAQLLRRLAALLPKPIRQRVANEYRKHFTHSFRNRKFYVPLKR